MTLRVAETEVGRVGTQASTSRDVTPFPPPVTLSAASLTPPRAADPAAGGGGGCAMRRPPAQQQALQCPARVDHGALALSPARSLSLES